MDAKVNEVLRLHLEAKLDEGTESYAQVDTNCSTITGSSGSTACSLVSDDGNLRLEGANGSMGEEIKHVAISKVAPDGHKPQDIQQSNSNAPINKAVAKCKVKNQDMVIEDLANVIHSDVTPNDSQNSHTQAHIPHRRVILQSPSKISSQPQAEALSIDLIKDAPATQDLDTEVTHSSLEPANTRYATPIIPSPSEPKGGTAPINGEQAKKKEISSAQLKANPHKVQHPPSNTIDLGQPNPRAITGPDPSTDRDSEGNKRKNRGGKPEQEKPLNAAELRKREKSLSKKEEALKIREKRLEQVEKDLAEARAYIVVLEAKVKDQEESNRILNQRILAGDFHAQQSNTSPANPPVHNTHAPPVHLPSSREDAPNTQVMQRLDMMQMEMKLSQMQMEMKYTQEMNNMRQTYMMDKVMTMQSCQAPPIYVQPQPHYAYPGYQPARQPAWWGTAPLPMSAPAFPYQQPQGTNISGGARLFNTNRYIPNPSQAKPSQPKPKQTPAENTSQSAGKPQQSNPQRDQQQATDLPQSESSTQEPLQNPGNRSATSQSQGNSNQAKGKEDEEWQGARPKDPSFLHPTGPTNHMTMKF